MSCKKLMPLPRDENPTKNALNTYAMTVRCRTLHKEFKLKFSVLCSWKPLNRHSFEIGKKYAK